MPVWDRSRRRISAWPRWRERSSASTVSRVGVPSGSLAARMSREGASGPFLVRAVSSPGRGIFLSGVPGGKVALGLSGRRAGVAGRVVRRAPQPGQMRKPPGSGAVVMGAWQRGHCIGANEYKVIDDGPGARRVVASPARRALRRPRRTHSRPAPGRLAGRGGRGAGATHRPGRSRGRHPARARARRPLAQRPAPDAERHPRAALPRGRRVRAAAAGLHGGPSAPRPSPTYPRSSRPLPRRRQKHRPGSLPRPKSSPTPRSGKSSWRARRATSSGAAREIPVHERGRHPLRGPVAHGQVPRCLEGPDRPAARGPRGPGVRGAGRRRPRAGGRSDPGQRRLGRPRPGARATGRDPRRPASLGGGASPSTRSAGPASRR